ncbi:MAG: tetratricopeptide repeat protein, partial [Candidatus Wallbacteria bacterium]|nr:tetratricopeptide repeat protein [Candidatus Wallbacteria bacterium]
AAHVELGHALVTTGDLPAARSQFEEALCLDPDCEAAETGLTRLMASLLPALENRSSTGPALEPRGPMPPSREATRIAALVAVVTSMIALAVLQPEVLGLLGRGGLWESAPAWIVLALVGFSVWLLLASMRFQRLMRLGAQLQRAGDTLGAIRTYQAAARSAPLLTGTLTHYNLGTAYHQQGDLASAIREYRTTLANLYGVEEWLPSAEHNLALALRELEPAERRHPLEENGTAGRQVKLLLPVGLGLGWAAATHVLAPSLGTAVAVATGLFAAWLSGRVGLPARRSAAARWFLNAGDSEAAIDQIREAIRLSPASADYRYVLGCALDEAGAHDAALKEFREALRLDPGFAAAARKMPGPATTPLGGAAPALVRPRTELRGPMRVSASQLTGCCLLMATAALAAMTSLSQLADAAQLRGLPPQAAASRALLFLFGGSLACLFASDLQSYVRLRRAAALEAEGRGRDAALQYRRTIAQTMGAVPLLMANYNLGLRFHERGVLREAILHYRRAIRSAPGAAMRLDARYNLAHALMELEDEVTRRDAPLVVRSEGPPRRPAAEFVLFAWMVPVGVVVAYATTAGVIGEPASLLLGIALGAVWLRAARIRRHLQAGLELLDVGDTEGAIDDLREATRISADSPTVRVHLARALEAAGELSASLREYQEALRLKPDLLEVRRRIEALMSDETRRAH